MTVTTTGLNFFYPESNATLVCTGTSSNVAIGSIGDVVVISNVGTAEAFVGFVQNSAGTITASGTITAAATGGYSIPSGMKETIRAVQDNNFLAGITNTGTTTLRVSRGSGQ